MYLRQSSPPLAEAVASALMLAIDMRDPATGIHCRMVGDLAGQIATSMGLSEDEVRLIILSGRLHDLGKLAIPDRILRNTDDLNDRQKEIIRTHAAHADLCLHAVLGLLATASATQVGRANELTFTGLATVAV